MNKLIPTADIVARLRIAANQYMGRYEPLENKAATEIERLRAEVSGLKSAAAESLAAKLTPLMALRDVQIERIYSFGEDIYVAVKVPAGADCSRYCLAVQALADDQLRCVPA